jgi:hypothetical protein
MRLTYADTTHRYHLDGKSVKSASSVAKIAADDYALTLWQQRMVAVGMTIRPDLAERVAVDLTNREAINGVVEAAHEAARTDAAANRGTQRHRVLELTLLDLTDQFVTDQQRADAEVLRRTLDRYGLEPIPDRVEQFVVWPQVPIVGRYDCCLNYQGRPAMFDLKSGRSAVDYPHSTITQLAIYAYAPQTSKTVVHKGDSWTCDDWGTMPDGLDLETGYVILVGDDDEVGTLYALDLVHGYRAATAAMDIVAWRREHDYGRKLAREVPPPQPAATGTGNAPSVVAVATEGAQTDERRQALRERYNGLCDDDKARFRALTIPPDDLDAVEAGLDQVDPFMETVAPVPATPIVPNVIPLRPDEGDEVSVREYNQLEARYTDLGPAEQMWMSALVIGADANMGRRRSRRRYHLYVALLTLAEHGYADPDHDEHVRSLVWEASGRDDAVLFANVTVGAAMGSLNVTRAQGLAVLALSLVLGSLHFLTDPETRRLQLVGA